MEITLNFYRPEDKLPETNRSVLIIGTAGAYWGSVMFSTEHGLFNVSGDNLKTAIYPMYWAELPEVEE